MKFSMRNAFMLPFLLEAGGSGSRPSSLNLDCMPAVAFAFLPLKDVRNESEARLRREGRCTDEPGRPERPSSSLPSLCRNWLRSGSSSLREVSGSLSPSVSSLPALPKISSGTPSTFGTLGVRGRTGDASPARKPGELSRRCFVFAANKPCLFFLPSAGVVGVAGEAGAVGGVGVAFVGVAAAEGVGGAMAGAVAAKMPLPARAQWWRFA